MSETGDGVEPGFPKPELKIENHGDIHLIRGARVYHEGSAYPDWRNAKGDRRAPYFKIDSYELTHQRRAPKHAGTRSDVMVREVFERGDAVGVFLYNREKRTVVVVRQLRLPTLHRAFPGADGWIDETVAGEVKPKKKGDPQRSREQVAIDETKEETGYTIADPELIASFYSSPGGTSERIFLYFAEVTNANKGDPEGGDESEDVVVVEWPLDVFTEKLRRRELVDPKLVIAGYYLQARLGILVETKQRSPDREAPWIYVHKDYPRIEIRIKTGDILKVRDVDVWLNPENKYMLMARVIDSGISASIRWGGAEKYNSGIVSFDTIGNDLRQKMQGRSEASSREVIETTPGALSKSNNVRRLLHLAVACQRRKDALHSSEDGRERLTVGADDVAPAVARALNEVHVGNSSAERLITRVRNWLSGYGWRCRSVLIPLIGTGEGGLSPRDAVPQIIDGILEFCKKSGSTTEVRTIYLLAYYESDKKVCEDELLGNGFIAKPGVIHWT